MNTTTEKTTAKTRTLFQAAIAIVLDSDRAYVNREELRREYRAYVYAHTEGLSEEFEASRKRIWEILIESSALQQAYAAKGGN